MVDINRRTEILHEILTLPGSLPKQFSVDETIIKLGEVVNDSDKGIKERYHFLGIVGNSPLAKVSFTCKQQKESQVFEMAHHIDDIIVETTPAFLYTLQEGGLCVRKKSPLPLTSLSREEIEGFLFFKHQPEMRLRQHERDRMNKIEILLSGNLERTEAERLFDLKYMLGHPDQTRSDWPEYRKLVHLRATGDREGANQLYKLLTTGIGSDELAAKLSRDYIKGGVFECID